MKLKTKTLNADPLYKRFEKIIADKIAQGELQAGDKLPNEFELAAEYGISQGTIRKALISLEARSLISRSPGRGTIVAVTTEEEALYNFFRMRGDDGNMALPSENYETIKLRKALKHEKKILGTDIEQVYNLVRVRNWKDQPFVFENISFPEKIFKDLEEHTPLPISLYPFLQKQYSITIMRTDESLKAVLADEKLAKRLDVNVGSPLLQSNRIAYDLNNTCVEFRQSIFVTDNATFDITLKRENSHLAV